MELRDRLADMLRQYFNWSPEAVLDARASAEALADQVLAIPEIAEALREMESLDDRLADAREDGWKACEEANTQ